MNHLCNVCSIFVEQVKGAYVDITEAAIEDMKQAEYAKWLKYYVSYPIIVKWTYVIFKTTWCLTFLH